MILLRKYRRPLLITGLLVFTYGLTGYLVWRYTEAQHQTYIATRNSTDDKARLVATERERNLEQTLQSAVQDTEAAKTEQEHLRVVIAIADGTNDRLHDELEVTRANLRGQGIYSTLAERSASAARAAMVLSDLFEQSTGKLIELAEATDQAQSRGRQCELSYNTVRDLNNKAP